MPQLKRMQRFRKQLKPELRKRPGIYGEIKDYFQRVDALSERFRAFELEADEALLKKVDPRNLKIKLKELEEAFWPLVEEGESYFPDFNPVEFRQSKKRPLDVNPMEKKEYILHKCYRVLRHFADVFY